MYDAPEKAKPHVEYACTVWDPFTKLLQHDPEIIHPICFICKFKGREGFTAPRVKLHSQTLSDRRKNNRQTLLMHLLSSKKNHGSLIDTYDELMNERLSTAITRAAGTGDPPTIYTKASIYPNSFFTKNSTWVQVRHFIMTYSNANIVTNCLTSLI